LQPTTPNLISREGSEGHEGEAQPPDPDHFTADNADQTDEAKCSLFAFIRVIRGKFSLGSIPIHLNTEAAEIAEKHPGWFTTKLPSHKVQTGGEFQAPLALSGQ
jgi:hypothetical protein